MTVRPADSRRAGFALVEIVILLVVVGLLLGGILKGQEMITQAKVKNVIADFSGVATAYAGYQDRYRTIPGDDPGAARWGATPGNGDAVLGGAYNSTGAADESRLWWDHLRRSGFVAGSGTQQPFNALSGMIGVQQGDGAGGAAFGNITRLILCSANVPDKVAIAVDTQLDDGEGSSGMMRAAAQAGPNPAIDGSVPAVAYVESGTNVYVLCRVI